MKGNVNDRKGFERVCEVRKGEVKEVRCDEDEELR